MVNTMEQLSEKKLSSVTSDEGTYFSQLNFRNRVWDSRKTVTIMLWLKPSMACTKPN